MPNRPFLGRFGRDAGWTAFRSPLKAVVGCLGPADDGLLDVRWGLVRAIREALAKDAYNLDDRLDDLLDDPPAAWMSINRS